MPPPSIRINPIGPPNPKILILGDCPSAQDIQNYKPFSGSAGDIVHKVLSKIGVNPNDVYFTYVHKTRPPEGEFENLYLDGKAATQPSPSLVESTSHLHSELRTIRPNVIVPLGSDALRSIIGKNGIDKWRGSILPSPFGKVLATYNPTRVFREYSVLPIFTNDLKRARVQSAFPEIRDLGLQLELSPSFERVQTFLSTLFANPCPIAFDIETTRANNKTYIRCLGLSDSSTHAICIPFFHSDSKPVDQFSVFGDEPRVAVLKNFWTEDQEHEILSLLNSVFLDKRISKFGQNVSFDSRVLFRQFGFEIQSLDFDTMSAAYAMYPEMEKGLDFLASIYTDIPYYSDYDSENDQELWHYNCLDCVATYQIKVELESSLLKRNATPRDIIPPHTPSSDKFTSSTFYNNHLHPATATMTRIGQRGVRIDLKVQDDLRTLYANDKKPFLEKFQLLAGSAVNPASPKQMQELLYKTLKLPVQISPKTKKPTTDEDAIENLVKKAPQHIEMFNALLHFKKREKLESTYLNCKLTIDNRLVTDYNGVGTVPGRCNSAKTIFGEGTNLQNFPNKEWIDLLLQKHDLGKPIRRMFCADEGCLLIKVDLSQAQFRIAVWDAQIFRLIKQYADNPNFDVHKWVASLIFKCLEIEVTKAQRDTAKNGVYGGNFRMAAKKAAVVYGLALEAATFVLAEYRKAIPEIPEWWARVERELNSFRTLISPLGRVRVFHDRLSDDLYREAYAHICQAVEADIIHRACVLSDIILTPLGCPPVMQIHDEIVFNCRKDVLQQCLPIIKNIMEYPIYFPKVSTPLIIPAEISYGENWLDVTKWKGGK